MDHPHASGTLVGNTFFASASAGSAVLLLILLIVAGRVLGDEDYGKFAFALALATIFETFVDFGLKEVTTRAVARDRSVANRFVANTLSLKLALAVGTMAVLVITARALRSEPDVRTACYLLGTSSVLRSYLLTARHVLVGLERFGLESIVVVTDRLLLLTLGVTALALGYGLVGLTASFVLGRLLATTVAYILVINQVGYIGPTFDVAFWYDLQLRALPFGAFVIVLYLYSYIDTLMLGVLRTDAETGLYTAAYRLYEGFSSIPAVLQVVLTPRLAREFVASRSRHTSLSRAGVAVALLLAFPVGAATFVLARPAVTLLFGSDYERSIGVLQILVSGFVFVFPLFVLHAVASSAGAERWLLRTALIGCTANIAMNVILIPRHGMYGAAIATVAGEGISVGILWWGIRQHLGRRTRPIAHD